MCNMNVVDQLVNLVDGDFMLVHTTTKRLRQKLNRTPALSELVKELMLIMAQKPIKME